ncbi:hypothetical protein ACFY3O_32895 [Streptomyces sp. NPDC001046]|uniref:hypothetical protein n=1 Tax=Streptomyces sp. NPDC001046 TaxID=3364543 RepID=UPI0036842E24
MTDPRTMLWQARKGPVPQDWRVFTKRRGKLSGFFHGTTDDPDPLLVITPAGSVEYISEAKPLAIVVFEDLTDVKLRVSTTDSSSFVSTWLDLRYDNGTKKRWTSSGFTNNLEALQAFLEAYGAHKAMRGHA